MTETRVYMTNATKIKQYKTCGIIASVFSAFLYQRNRTQIMSHDFYVLFIEIDWIVCKIRLKSIDIYVIQKVKTQCEKDGFLKILRVLIDQQNCTRILIQAMLEDGNNHGNMIAKGQLRQEFPHQL